MLIFLQVQAMVSMDPDLENTPATREARQRVLEDFAVRKEREGEMERNKGNWQRSAIFSLFSLFPFLFSNPSSKVLNDVRDAGLDAAVQLACIASGCKSAFIAFVDWKTNMIRFKHNVCSHFISLYLFISYHPYHLSSLSSYFPSLFALTVNRWECQLQSPQ